MENGYETSGNAESFVFGVFRKNAPCRKRYAELLQKRNVLYKGAATCYNFAVRDAPISSASTEEVRRMQNEASIPTDLKLGNRRAVLRQFDDNREHTVAEITEATGIGKLTVLKAIQFFCEKGILSPAGRGKSTERGGKKPTCYRFCCEKPTLSITMWPDRLGLTLYRLDRTRLAQSVLRWVLPCAAEDAFALVKTQALSFLAENDVSVSELYGVGLSTAGIIDYENQVLKYSAQSPSWGRDVPVGRFLRSIFGERVCIVVDNNGKNVGRAVLSAKERQKSSLVFFTSWGLSACLSLDGRVLNGAHSLIGEVGHMMLAPQEPQACACGGHGCAEQLLSLQRLIQEVSANPPSPESPLYQVPLERLSFGILFAASAQGDPYARAQVRRLAETFALLLRNLSLAFDPELVVFTGDYAAADAWFDACLKAELASFRYSLGSCLPETRYDRRELLALDAEGCAQAILAHFFSRPELYQEGD